MSIELRYLSKDIVVENSWKLVDRWNPKKSYFIESGFGLEVKARLATFYTISCWFSPQEDPLTSTLSSFNEHWTANSSLVDASG